MTYVNKEQFFMVWSPSGNQPTHKHENECEALKEAKRLAKIHKGNQFFVLASHCTVTFEECSVVFHDVKPF
jgi:hypothetical protein